MVGLGFAGTVPVQNSAHILEVGEEIDWGVGGAWARVMIEESGDLFFYAAGGEFFRMELLEDYTLMEEEKVPLSGRTNLDDHSIQTCPDGSYLHAASGKTVETNDSGYMMMYDPSWNRLYSHVLAENNPEIAYNDMPLICHERGRFVAFIDFDVWGTIVYELDETGLPIREVKIPEIGLAEGGTFLEDPNSGNLALVTSNHDNSAIEVNFLDWDLNFLSTKTLFEIDVQVDRNYWPQAVEVIGDRIVVAYVNQPRKEGRLSDWGDMWLGILDLEWNLIERHAIVTEAAQDGCMRPGLAYKDGTLIYTYDKILNHPPGDVTPRLVPIALNLEAFGLAEEPVDTGMKDTQTREDTGQEDTGQPSEPKGSCACGSTTVMPLASWSWLILGPLWLRRRR